MSLPGVDLNSRNENNAENSDINIRFLIWIFLGNYRVLSTFWVDLRSENEILTSKFLIDIFFFNTDLIDLIRKPNHNNRFPIHIVNWDPALQILLMFPSLKFGFYYVTVL